MRRLGLFFSIDSISFTCLTVMYALLDMGGLVPPIGRTLIVQFFLVDSIIATLQVLLDRFSPMKDKMGYKLMALQFLFVLLPVFGIGGLLFGWFPLNLEGLVYAFLICLVVYLAVIGILIVKYRADANEINKAIHDRRKNGT